MVAKMTDLIAGVAIKEFARFKPEIYFFDR